MTWPGTPMNATLASVESNLTAPMLRLAGGPALSFGRGSCNPALGERVLIDAIGSVRSTPRQFTSSGLPFAMFPQTARFFREVRAVIRVRNPHVTRTLDVDVHEGRPICVVMALLVLGIGTRAGVALGDPNGGDPARLFEEAKALMEQGQYADACPKLARSRAIDPQIGTTLNLAYCYENLGRTASSWSLWLDAATMAQAHGQTDRQEFARRRAARLEPRLLRLTITVAAQPELAKIDVRLDGSSLPKERWGAPTPVDPGEHWVQATSPGRRSWTIELQLDDQHVPLVSVPPLPMRIDEGQGGPAPTPVWTTRRKAAVAIGAVGTLSVVLGSFLAGVAKSTYDHADCFGNSCNMAGTVDRSRAYTEGGIATAAFGVGASAFASGALLWFSSRPAAVQVEPTIGARDIGLSFGRAW
jgi:hypothetical protein